MHANTTRSAIDKKTGRQQVFVCLLLLPFVLFTLSGFTFIPNKVQTANQATEASLPLTLPMSTLHTAHAADDSCLDVIIVEQFSLSGVKIYFNNCALEHLNALLASADAGAAFIGVASLLCEECVPIAAVITTTVAGLTATNDFLQYASQQCGGAFLDISWDGGIQFESACSPQENGS